MTAAPRCSLCRRTDARVWKASSVDGDLVPQDLAITDSRYGTTLAILECSCGFRFADPRTVPDLVALYEALDDQAYRDTADVRRVQQRRLVRELLRRRAGTRTLLDVGAANGLLVDEAARAGLQAVGVEPSEALSAEAREHGIEILTGVLPHADLADRRFDAVTLVDVIEHVPDPVELLRLAHAHVAPDGCVFVVTPDIASLAARALGRRWWHLRLAHVVYFTKATLTRALEVAGFVPETWWRPGWVFEVGYLTERVGEYVPPIGTLASRHEDSPLMHRSVPLNLYDSLAVIARPRSG
jgi:2-polyprenyl-3-methyl-5-hydroxy-6-metoxy-1,4-benzoquinol methylase